MDSQPGSFLARHEFLIRRLHSLAGLIPVGAYMVVHLLTNATVLASPQFFQEQVDRIHDLGPALPLVEWTFIFIPLLFHGILGVVIIRGGLSNTANYPYTNNYRYFLQRVTGIIAFLFIMVHVFQMHHLGAWLGDGWGIFQPHLAALSASKAFQNVWFPLIYLVGVLACVYHLANGIWTMGITWGVWISPAAQKRASKLCAGFGVVLALVGLASLWGMMRVNPDAAAKVESRHADKYVDRDDPDAPEEPAPQQQAAADAPVRVSTDDNAPPSTQD